MSNPHIPVDPLHVDEDAYPLRLIQTDAFDDGWDAGYAAADDARWCLGAVLLAALSGAIVGALVVWLVTSV